MRKAIYAFLISIALLIIFLHFGLNPLTESLDKNKVAGIKVTSLPQAEVFINNESVGKTPFSAEDLKVGEIDLRLITASGEWNGKVKLTQGAVTVINREVSANLASSSGEVLTLYPGKGIVISSRPDNAEVVIDSKNYGKTPLFIEDLAPGEYTIFLSYPNYLKRSIRAKLPEAVSLHLDVDLAMGELDLKDPQVQISTEKIVVVAETPLGFLRVRDKPTTLGKEITKVSTGDTLTMVEDLGPWVKIKLENGEVGYVSSQYIQK